MRERGLPGSIVARLLDQRHEYRAVPRRLRHGKGRGGGGDTALWGVEFALDNIRFNTVAPGTTITPGSGAYIDEDVERDRTAVAMGRRADPEEQAGPILFLLSDMASYITGQTLLVDGGLNLKWTHLGADNTSLFLKNEDFRAAIKC